MRDDEQLVTWLLPPFIPVADGCDEDDGEMEEVGNVSRWLDSDRTF